MYFCCSLFYVRDPEETWALGPEATPTPTKQFQWSPEAPKLQGIQKYIRTEILGIYGAPNYRNTRKSLEILEKPRKTYKKLENKGKN